MASCSCPAGPVGFRAGAPSAWAAPSQHPRKWQGRAERVGRSRCGSWSCDWETELPLQAAKESAKPPSDPACAPNWPSPCVPCMNTENGEGGWRPALQFPRGLRCTEHLDVPGEKSAGRGGAFRVWTRAGRALQVHLLGAGTEEGPKQGGGKQGRDVSSQDQKLRQACSR